MMAIVFFMGMFLDWLGIVMIVFPIFLPIMDMFGFDRLWIVAVTAVMLQTCFMTPPFGFALFYIKGIVPPSVKIQAVSYTHLTARKAMISCLNMHAARTT